jgi:hypothetical protein
MREGQGLVHEIEPCIIGLTNLVDSNVGQI